MHNRRATVASRHTSSHSVRLGIAILREVRSCLHKMRRLRPDIKARCVGIAFADDENHAGLQAADLIAYCARAEVLAKNDNEPAPIVREVIEMFNAQDQSEHAVVYRVEGKGLGDGEFESEPRSTLAVR